MMGFVEETEPLEEMVPPEKMDFRVLPVLLELREPREIREMLEIAVCQAHRVCRVHPANLYRAPLDLLERMELLLLVLRALPDLLENKEPMDSTVNQDLLDKWVPLVLWVPLDPLAETELLVPTAPLVPKESPDPLELVVSELLVPKDLRVGPELTVKWDPLESPSSDLRARLELPVSLALLEETELLEQRARQVSKDLLDPKALLVLSVLLALLVPLERTALPEPPENLVSPELQVPPVKTVPLVLRALLDLKAHLEKTVRTEPTVETGWMVRMVLTEETDRMGETESMGRMELTGRMV